MIESYMNQTITRIRVTRDARNRPDEETAQYMARVRAKRQWVRGANGDIWQSYSILLNKDADVLAGDLIVIGTYETSASGARKWPVLDSAIAEAYDGLFLRLML